MRKLSSFENFSECSLFHHSRMGISSLLIILQRRAIFDALLKLTTPARISDLYAFVSGPSRVKSTSPKVRLLDEYFRLLGKGSLHASLNMIESGSFTLSNDLWRLSSVNSNYAMCQTYPFALVIPKSIR